MCSCEDAEPLRYCQVTTIKARSKHYCDECGDLILPGQIYQRIKGWSQEGDGWEQTNTCARCTELREAFSKFEGCYPALGTLKSTILDDCSDILPAEFIAMLPVEWNYKANAS
jgi:hypothetical protein